jgi:hypothetical protein
MMSRGPKWIPNTQKSLIVVALFLLGEFVIGTLVAVQRNLPAELGGKTGKTAAEEFLTNGTAISPPAVFGLVIALFVLFVALPRPRWLGTLGVIGLLLLGVVGIITGLAEPIVSRIFNPATFDFPLALLESAGFLLSFLMVACAGVELVHRVQRRTPRGEQNGDQVSLKRSFQ